MGDAGGKVMLSLGDCRCSLCNVRLPEGIGIMLQNCLHPFCRPCILEMVSETTTFQIPCPATGTDEPMGAGAASWTKCSSAGFLTMDEVEGVLGAGSVDFLEYVNRVCLALDNSADHNQNYTKKRKTDIPTPDAPPAPKPVSAAGTGPKPARPLWPPARPVQAPRPSANPVHMPGPGHVLNPTRVHSPGPSAKPVQAPGHVRKPVHAPSPGPSARPTNVPSPMSLVDKAWELIDPTPDIFAMFMAFNKTFFQGKLGMVTVSWSPRMTTCAGICRYTPRTREIMISLSQPLLKLRPRKDLVETLLHEMIHALLFLEPGKKHDRDGHGEDFQNHMHRINKTAGTNITVYHSFHQEVNHYKTHWWQCTGDCRNRAPFFGMVKRAMNRAPGPSDFWFPQHQSSCGGTFVKVKEPPKPEKKSKGNKLGNGTQKPKPKAQPKPKPTGNPFTFAKRKSK